MKHPLRLLGLALLLAVGWTVNAQAGWQVGSSYDIRLQNFPNAGVVNTSATLDLTTKTVATNLSVKEFIFADGPNSTWLELDFETLDGGPLASSPDAHWQIDVTGIDTTAPALGSGFYYYWSVDGTPVSPIFAFGGFLNISTIPAGAPSSGPAYVNVGFPPFGPLTEFGTFAFVSPYSFARDGGIPIDTANGFHMGVRINEVQAAVPESATLIGAGTGLALALLAGRRPTRKRAC